MTDTAVAERKIDGIDLPALRISEIVLHTNQFDALKNWYITFLQAEPEFEFTHPDPSKVDPNDIVQGFERVVFLLLNMEFPYNQVLGIFQVPNLGESQRGPGLNHMQFRQSSLDDLVKRVDHLARIGIKPFQSMNYGPGTSFYFEDPDGNKVELSAINVATREEYFAFHSTPAAKKSPMGIKIDADEFCSRYLAGDQDVVLLPA